ncbi:MAG: hypothetical protein IRZ00_01130 [Gemmatimonadetes bacterium]|nr:hypothetical protein [Gemmatimonadota bacterium]
MGQRDTVDFVTAFAVGAILGVGAALLLRPEPATSTSRLLKPLRPHSAKVRNRARRAWRDASKRRRKARGARAELVAAGREVLAGFREELRDLVAAARDELVEAVDHQVKEARRAMRKRSHRVGR